MKLIILGPPGSGKGTIAEKLEKGFKFQHISAGELLREEVRQDTPIGRDIKPILERGELVSNQLVSAIVKLEAQRAQNKNHYLLDGFPRALEQAKGIGELKIDKVLYLDVPLQAVVERLSGRRVCRQGIHNYHVKYIPPKKPGICDVDKSPLVRRKDDSPASVKRRFQVFKRQTVPVIRYYKKKRILITVDARGDPESVYRLVKKALRL